MPSAFDRGGTPVLQVSLTIMLAAQASSPPLPFSWPACLTMLAVLGVSVLMFVMLVRRWTSRRQWVSLAQWAHESGFHLRPARRDLLPAPLGDVVTSDSQVRFHLCDPTTTLVQFEAAAFGKPGPASTSGLESAPKVISYAGPSAPGDTAGLSSYASTARVPQRFNVLVRRRAVGGPVGGLRPAEAKVQLIDLLPMRDFASMTLGDRFIIYGSDLRDARRLADSGLLALVPQNVGIILLEQHLLLDFSTRPFDAIEFGRMITLADQLTRFVV